jgi:hypothetical protein
MPPTSPPLHRTLTAALSASFATLALLSVTAFAGTAASPDTAADNANSAALTHVEIYALLSRERDRLAEMLAMAGPRTTIRVATTEASR